MFRTPAWFIRELERTNRAHAAERAELIATISRLAGKPAPDPWQPPAAPAPDDKRGEILEDA